MNLILIYITNPNKKTAKKIALNLLKKRLIACGNIFKSDSLYWWRGKIVNENEYILIAKTTEANYEKVKNEVEKIHPYKIPCVIKIEARTNEKYGKWLKREI